MVRAKNYETASTLLKVIQRLIDWLLFFRPRSIRCMQIFAGVPVGGGLKWEWGCRRQQFLAIWVVTSLETSEIRPAVLNGDMLPVVGLWLIAKWVT